MRVASFSMYDTFMYNQQNTMKSLNDINSQISSGLSIQYGYQNIDVSVNTLRLDQEENSLAQTSQAAKGGLEFSQNSDKALNDITTALTSFKTKLINAASDTNGSVNRDAIAKELTDLKNYMMNVANTSINGRYLFSGSAMGVKPIASDGSYMGNGQQVKALVDSSVQYAFNVDGQSLFLGQDSDYQKSITTNVPMKNTTLLNAFPPEDRYLTADDTIKDMTGNNGDGKYSYFYVSGKTSEGTSFKHIIQESIDAPVSDLLSKIKNEYSGNVDVTLNDNGEIEIKDIQSGSSQLDFNIVGYDNTTPLTKATAGLITGSKSITVQDATGLAAGDVLNINGIGQVTIDSTYTPGSTTVPLTLPLPNGKDQLAGDVEVRKVNATTINSSSSAAQLTAGSTSLNLTSVTGISVGQTMMIGSTNYQISGIDTTSSAPDNIVSFTPALSANVNAGDSVEILPSTIANGQDGARVTQFTKSSGGPISITNATGSADYWDHSQFGFNIEMRRKSDNKIATSADLLTNVLGNTAGLGITLSGIVPPATTPTSTTVPFTLNSASTVGDYMSQIQSALDNKFGQNKFQATLDSYGKVNIKDLSISDANKTLDSSNLVSVQLTSSSATPTFSAVNGTQTDAVYFDKSGSKLTGNIPQIIKSTTTEKLNNYATPDTKLSQVAGLTSLSPADQISSVSGNTITVLNGLEYSSGDKVTIANTDYTVSSVAGNVLTLSATPPASATSLNRKKEFTMDITDKNGIQQSVTLSFGTNMSTFTMNGTSYEIVDASNPQGHTPADNMTYKQLTDVISMVTSGTLPAVAPTTASSASGSNTITLGSTASYNVGDTISIGSAGTYTISAIPSGTTLTLSSNLTSAVASGDEIMRTTDYNTATIGAQKSVKVGLNQTGQITLEDLTSSGTNTALMFSIYDSAVNSNFSTNKSINKPTDNAMSFNSNTMLTIDQPHTDFFGQLQDAIDAVKSGKLRADYTNTIDERSTGIENAITSIDHALQHTIKKHTEVGAISNAFTAAGDRSDALKLNVISVRSSFIDTDIAQAASDMNQKMLSYQAMMSTISKISGLSLLNYLK